MPTQTVQVAVTFTLDSSIGSPPFNIAGCSGIVSYNDSTPAKPWGGWNAVDIGIPVSGGAAFTVNVVDSSYAVNQTVVKNWALTFLPRGATSDTSPFSSNQNTVAGSGGTTVLPGNTSLDLSSVKIKNAGDWDWTLMVQMQMSDTEIHCFASDPEMDVDAP